MKTTDEKIFSDSIKVKNNNLAPAVLINENGDFIGRWLDGVHHNVAAALPRNVGTGILLFLHYTDSNGQLHLSYYKALTYNHLPPRLKREDSALRYDYVCVIEAANAPNVPMNAPHAFMRISFEEHLLHLQSIPLPILVQDEIDSKREIYRPITGVFATSIYNVASQRRQDRLTASGKFAKPAAKKNLIASMADYLTGQ